MSLLSSVLIWVVVWFPPLFLVYFFPSLCVCSYACGYFMTYAQTEMVFKNF